MRRPVPFTALILALIVALTLIACSSPQTREDPAAGAAAGLAQAEGVARLLAGEYAGRESTEDQPGSALVRLNAAIERIAPGAVSVRLRQAMAGSGEREFRVTFEPSGLQGRLHGHFAPLGPDGVERAACPLEVVLRENGFVARTSADTCRFGSGPQTTALIKEIAHDGQTLVIGDRVVDPASGENLVPDRVLELQRLVLFEGWAGVRDHPEGSWRVAGRFEVLSDGVPVAPLDAAGMPLDIELELAPHRMTDERPVVLRLRVFDAASGELIGQSWAALDSSQLGLALPTLQLGLARP